MKKNALLLSLKPRFAHAIFDGTKTVELRRVRPRLSSGDLVLIYVSSPTCRLEGAFEVAQVLDAAPDKLWSKVRGRCALTRLEYDAYFADAEVAYGIVIRKKWRLESPVDLAAMRARNIRPPQGYQYLAAAELGQAVAPPGGSRRLQFSPQQTRGGRTR